MSSSTGKEDAKEQAKHHLEAHAKAIDALHHKLAALHDSHDAKGKEHLQHAVDKYKKAHATFVDDVLFTLSSR